MSEPTVQKDSSSTSSEEVHTIHKVFVIVKESDNEDFEVRTVENLMAEFAVVPAVEEPKSNRCCDLSNTNRGRL